MLREVLVEADLAAYVEFCEGRGWEQINLPGASLIDMRQKGREILTVSSQGPKEGVYVLYDEAARMAGEWKEQGVGGCAHITASGWCNNPTAHETGFCKDALRQPDGTAVCGRAI
jgi:hypothetical protein